MGLDIVDVSRFQAALLRRPMLAARVLTPGELAVAAPERLAARFAAKEAVAKALGAPGGLRWHDCEVVLDDAGVPRLEVRGTVTDRAALLGVRGWHLSLSHDAGVAAAMVVVES